MVVVAMTYTRPPNFHSGAEGTIIADDANVRLFVWEELDALCDSMDGVF